MIKVNINDVFGDPKDYGLFFEDINNCVEDALERTESLPGTNGQLNATLIVGDRYYSVVVAISWLETGEKKLDVEIFRIEKEVYKCLKIQNKKTGFEYKI